MAAIGELEAIINANGTQREHDRLEGSTGAEFGADLIYREENGFELWLGSLEDALNLEALEQQSISGILNCALEDCRLECESCRSSGGFGRRRCHARGASAMKNSDFTVSAQVDDGCKKKLDRDQIKELANFDEDWYSLMLQRDVSYLGIAADDKPGYAMNIHFIQTLGFLANCRQEGRRVLVHCVEGINRSSTALVAFLCADRHMRLEDAINVTSKSRGFILSNASFLQQLLESYGPVVNTF
mmetsp:Transcript_104050/g.164296  ORF Transcript_104050/g.164296 Transcript_104050/m.164296 type:complete len:243 (+) Transcript_104050:53-781(+)